jgi:hypothetical protein
VLYLDHYKQIYMPETGPRRPALPPLVLPDSAPSPSPDAARTAPRDRRGRDSSGDARTDREYRRRNGDRHRNREEQYDITRAREIRDARRRAMEASGDSTKRSGAIYDRHPDAPSQGKVVRLKDYPEVAKNLLVRAGTYAASQGKPAAKLALGSAWAMGELGVKTGGFFTKSLLVGIDFFSRKIDKLADKMIDKNLPIPLRWVVNSTVSLLDGSAKLLGLDKTLYAHLMKDREDRKKLAAKLLKELRADEQKQERKVDAKEKKKEVKAERDQRRFARLSREKGIGPELARIMVYEMDEIEAGEADDTTKDEDEKKDDMDKVAAAAAA